MVVVVVAPVHSLSFPTMNLKKTMRTIMVVAQWEVVLRLVLHVRVGVVRRDQMANLVHVSSSVVSFHRWWIVNLHVGSSALFGFRWNGAEIYIFGSG